MKSTLLRFLFIVLFFSCSSEPEVIPEPDIEIAPDNVLNDNVKLMSDSDNNSLLKVELDHLIFESVKEGLEIGDILVSDVTENAPFGYLRKIVSFDNSVANQMKIETVAASLRDIFKHSNINLEYSLNESDFMKNTGFKFNLGSLDLSDQFSLNGEVDLQPKLLFALNIDSISSQVNYFELGLRIETDTEIKLSYAGVESASIKESFEIFEIDDFFTIRFRVPAVLFGVPVVIPINITTELEGKFNYMFEGPTVSFEMNVLGNYETGISYDGSEFNSINRNNISAKLPAEPIQAQILSADLSVGLELDYQLYDLEFVEAFTAAEGYNKFSIDSEFTCEYEYGLRLRVGLDSDILEAIGIDEGKKELSKDFPLGKLPFCAEPFIDDDLDGVGNDVDNCPKIYNPAQDDADMDMIGDLCDDEDNSSNQDADGDGIIGPLDPCPWHHIDDGPPAFYAEFNSINTIDKTIYLLIANPCSSSSFFASIQILREDGSASNGYTTGTATKEGELYVFKESQIVDGIEAGFIDKIRINTYSSANFLGNAIIEVEF